jgi:Putative prokaryotic signal transducing protein
MAEEYSNEKVVIAHVAENATEALVIRGLLESAGIQSPGSVSTDPFPIPENPEGPHNVEIFVLESQADEARKIIAEYQSANNVSLEESDDPADSNT